MSNSAAGSLLLVLASANLIALVSLLGEASSGYLDTALKHQGHSSKLRLQLFRCLLVVVSVAAGLKAVLLPKLADDLIAAWFVGQGFALQTIIRDIIAGIVARYNSDVRGVIIEGTGKGQVKYKEKLYTPQGANIASITLASDDGKYIRVLPWSELHEMELHR
jgi:hypothetical protein